MAIYLELSEEFAQSVYQRVKHEEHNIAALLRRKGHVKSSVFNFNALSEHQCLKDFRFKHRVVAKIAEMLAWSGVTERNENRIDNITAVCVVLHRLATNCR